MENVYQCTSSTASLLPDLPGVYYFYLSGLHRSRVAEIPDLENEFEKERFVEYVYGKVEKMCSVQEEVKWEGVIKESKSPRVSRFMYLSGHARRKLKVIYEDLAIIAQKKDMERYIEGLNFAFYMSGPIYIGMTRKQTLAKRYEQHLISSQQLEIKEKIFGARLLGLGISWGDLSVGYRAFEWSEINVVKSIESASHAIAQPVLSDS